MMKKQILIVLSLLMVGLVGCKKDNPKSDLPNQTDPEKGKEETIPKWNKANTGVVYFISNLQNAPFANTKEDYKKVGDFLKDKKYAIAVIDRSDVPENSDFNAGVTATYYANKKNAFAYNRYNSKTLEGSTLIVNAIEKQQVLKIDRQTYLTYLPTRLIPEIVFPFTTLRLEDESQVAGVSSQLSYWREQNFVCIGTAKNELLQSLKQQVQSKSSLKFTTVESSDKLPYSIFMIAPKHWILREKEVIKQDQKSIYELKIEANVFY